MYARMAATGLVMMTTTQAILEAGSRFGRSRTLTLRVIWLKMCRAQNMSAIN